MSTNLPEVITPPAGTEFEKLRTEEIHVSGSEYDIVLGFFVKHTESNTSARTLANDFIKACKINNLSATDLIADMNTLEGLELNNVIAAILNESREKTSLLGYRQERMVLDRVSRTIIA